MTLFDDIQNEIDAGIEDIGFPTEGYHHIMKASEMIDELREEYAPTVEMTKAQRDLILRNQDEDRLYEILGDGDGYYFNADYWSRLEPHEVAQAYLHPETIKIVDE